MLFRKSTTAGTILKSYKFFLIAGRTIAQQFVRFNRKPSLFMIRLDYQTNLASWSSSQLDMAGRKWFSISIFSSSVSSFISSFRSFRMLFIFLSENKYDELWCITRNEANKSKIFSFWQHKCIVKSNMLIPGTVYQWKVRNWATCF